MGSRQKLNEIDDSFEQFAASLREAADVDSQDQITSRGYESEEGWSCRLKDYVFEFILGTGAFGDVIKARNLAEKKDCAVKLLNYRVSSKRHILDEIKAMSRLSHPNLVGKYSVSVINRSTIFIVMPLLWNLRKLCEESRELRLNMARLYAMASITQLKPVSPVSENCAGQIVHQLLTGLDFMHKNRYIHRDLKSGNLLVSNKGTVKIGDFGLTKQFETGHFKLGKIQTPVGTRYYMAPEITLRFVKVSEKPYDIRAETWSIGAIMCELLLNCLPFAHYPAHAEGMVKTLKAATKEELMFPPRIYEGIAMDLSPACRDFIDKCLVGDPAQRKTCSELLKNSWVKKFKGKKDVIQEELLDDEIKKGVIGKLKAMNGKFLAHNGGARRPLNVNMLFNPMGTRMYYLKFTVDATAVGRLERKVQQDCRACLLILTNNRLISTANYLYLCERIPELVEARAEIDFKNSYMVFPFSRKDDAIPDKENLTGQALIVVTYNNSEWDSVLSKCYPRLVKKYEKAMDCRRMRMKISQKEREENREDVIRYVESEEESDGDSGVASNHKTSSGLSSESSVEPEARRGRTNLLKRGRLALKAFFNKEKEESSEKQDDD